jgi:type 1 fimbria pilin
MIAFIWLKGVVMRSFFYHSDGGIIRSSVVALLLVLGPIGVAHGTCSVVDSSADKEQAVNIDYTFPSQVTVPRDLPVGGVIARARIAGITRTGRSLYCGGGDQITSTGSGAADALIEDKLGHLLVDGVRSGVAYQVRKMDGTALGITDSKLHIAPHPGIFWGFSQATARDYFFEIVLVKTSERILPGSQFSPGEKLRATAMQSGQPPFTVALLKNMSSVTVVPQTCQVSMPSLVSLGAHNIKVFTGVGSTSKATSFNLAIQCSGLQTKVYMTMSDPIKVGNISDKLSFTDDSSASGLSMQILRDGAAVALGPDSRMAGTPNQFKVFDASADKSMHVQTFQVRYVQTEKEVVAGTANSRVTVAMSYQ